jgi:hypothetical protein
MFGNDVRQLQVLNAVNLDTSYARHFYATHATEKSVTVHQETTNIHSISPAVLDVFHLVSILPPQADLEIMIYSRHMSIERPSPEKRVTPVRSQTGVI